MKNKLLLNKIILIFFTFLFIVWAVIYDEFKSEIIKLPFFNYGAIFLFLLLSVPVVILIYQKLVSDVFRKEEQDTIIFETKRRTHHNIFVGIKTQIFYSLILSIIPMIFVIIDKGTPVATKRTVIFGIILFVLFINLLSFFEVTIARFGEKKLSLEYRSFFIRGGRWSESWPRIIKTLETVNYDEARMEVVLSLLIENKRALAIPVNNESEAKRVLDFIKKKKPVTK